MKPFDHAFESHDNISRPYNPSGTIKASHGSILVDCANYYRDLHESLTKARHSIFILGWDIDSRIKLIRHEKDRVHETPVTLLELLTRKAQENPHLQIYMNKWNYAFFMAQTREPFSVWKWRKAALPNIHYCHDSMVPTGACHHQKIVVVDDEVAFIGGMDVAIARWDTREHKAYDPKRKDPGGIYNAGELKKFPPYHDIQTVVSGEAAQALAKIVRERWVAAAGYEAIPLRPLEPKHEYPAWPDTDPPDFTDIDISLCRTLPKYGGEKGVFEIEKSYLDQIATAENFIYMENQYFTVKKIAAALNQRLKERPNLRALLVSSYNPQGFIEKVSMWAGRIRFRKLLEEGVADRVCMAYPASRIGDSADFQSIRIHSKIMAVDDKLLRIGSANINNRSMKLDTEADLVYWGGDEAQRTKIADVRNDLIHEHSGIAKETVAEMVRNRVSPSEYLNEPEGSRKKLFRIEDKEFFARFPAFIAERLGDPRREIIPEILPLPYVKNMYIQYFTKRRIAKVFFLFALLVAGALAWKHGLFHEFGSKEKLLDLFEQIRTDEFAIPKAIFMYTVCSILFVPVTIMTGVTALIFGYWYGILISLSGSLLCAALIYGVGKLANGVKFKFMDSAPVKRVEQYAKNSNVISITFLRMLPIAPFNVVNAALGLLRVPFLIFMLGTLFGLLPGKLVAVFLADSVGELWRNPDWENMGLIALGLGAWVGIVWLTHYLYKLWQGHNRPAEA